MPHKKFNCLGLAVLTLCFALVLSGCSSTRTRTVYVSDAPPPRQSVNRPRAPVSNAVWIQGQWRWNGYRYVWLPGYWETRSRGVWVPGYWQPSPYGWYFVYGYWR